jgi:MYXO-CTERM domain-containing protein
MKHTLSATLAAMLAIVGMVFLWRRRSKTE